MRSRTVRPEFWSDEKLAQISMYARLAYIGLWTTADDFGCSKGHPAWLKSQLFPYDDIKRGTFEEWINELISAGMIAQFTENGEKFLYIKKFLKYQKINRPSAMRNPKPPKEILNEDSMSTHGVLIDETETETETEFKQKQNKPPLPPKGELKPKSKSANITELALYAAEKLRLTSGIKKRPLENLVRANGGDIDRVRAAIDRAARYYEIAKAEHWRSFVIARRFSKFLEFYDEAFADDAVADAYIAKIRAANEREKRIAKKEASLMIGAPRQEPEDAIDPWPSFIARLPNELLPLRGDFERFREARCTTAEVEEKILDLLKNDEELKTKLSFFIENLKKTQQTPENIRKYKLNFLKAKFKIPELEDEK